MRSSLRTLGRRREPESRAALIDRKHRIEGEIRQLNRRISSGLERHEKVGHFQKQVERLRAEHLETRLRIDRTP